MGLLGRNLVKAKKPKAVRRLAKRVRKMAKRRAEDEAAAINAFNVPTQMDLLVRAMYDSMILRQSDFYGRRWMSGQDRTSEWPPVIEIRPANTVDLPYNGPELL